MSLRPSVLLGVKILIHLRSDGRSKIWGFGDDLVSSSSNDETELDVFGEKQSVKKLLLVCKVRDGVEWTLDDSKEPIVLA